MFVSPLRAENKKDVDTIHEFLLVKGVEAVAVHGSKDQEEREWAIQSFKAGACVGGAVPRVQAGTDAGMPQPRRLITLITKRAADTLLLPQADPTCWPRSSAGQKDVLIATDVASKGLDFEGIQHVINYDMPEEIENYVHRIGRTGGCGWRAGGASCWRVLTAREAGHWSQPQRCRWADDLARMQPLLLCLHVARLP